VKLFFSSFGFFHIKFSGEMMHKRWQGCEANEVDLGGSGDLTRFDGESEELRGIDGIGRRRG
jgi:hypothetical protein